MFMTKETVDQMLLELRTAFIGKILSVSGKTAKVQPLTMIRQQNGRVMKPAVLLNVPVCSNVFRMGNRTVTIEGVSFTLPVLTGPSGGDIVICVCMDRDATETKKGGFGEPALGHHSLSDAFIVAMVD